MAVPLEVEAVGVEPTIMKPIQLMKSIQTLSTMKTSRCFFAACTTGVVLSLGFISNLNAAPAKTFATPDDAVRALAKAIDAHDTNALAAIFGPSYDDITSPDPVQAENELTVFGAALSRSNHVERVSDDHYTLEVGEDQWPFPVPLVRKDGAWHFDTNAGKDEVINRRVGDNELHALNSLRAAAQAQRDYAAADHDGDEVREFAQKIVSTSGHKDGLYWSPLIDGEISPLGPAFAAAQREGYLRRPLSPDAPEPFHGYLFKILKRQGKHAPGGAYDYVINGNMIGGFAFVAWPSEYGESGVMTFIINQQGKVYQKDLGPQTESIVEKMKEYDPDPSWTRSKD